MTDKFYGIWFPARGWFRVVRTEDQKSVVWSTTEHKFARKMARELGGKVKRTDLALSEPSAEAQMLQAEASAKGKTIWQTILRIIRRSPAGTSTN
jgi:type VI protein secretion system component Hcp